MMIIEEKNDSKISKKAMIFHLGMNLISTYALISIAFFDALFALSKSNNKRSAKLCALLRLRQW